MFSKKVICSVTGIVFRENGFLFFALLEEKLFGVNPTPNFYLSFPCNNLRNVEARRMEVSR